MISYVLTEAIKSNLFEKIHISTNSIETLKIIENLGHNIDFMRPDNLSDDFTPLVPVIEFVLNQYAQLNLFYDEVWLLLPCSPLINSVDLIEANSIKSNNNKCGLIAVVEFPAPIEWAYKLNLNSELTPLNKKKLFYRSQDLEKKYYDSGTFMIFNIDNNSNKNSPRVYNENFLGYKISKLKGIDIDTEEDWKLAEAIYSNYFKNS